jgi:hypothetical protein
MSMADEILHHQYPEMRWRILSLAADFDRIERAAGDNASWKSDPRISELRQALQIVLTDAPNRAEQVQRLLSDTTPPPPRT